MNLHLIQRFNLILFIVFVILMIAIIGCKEKHTRQITSPSIPLHPLWENPTGDTSQSNFWTEGGNGDFGASTGEGECRISTPAGDFLLAYTTQLGTFHISFRATQNAILHIGLTPNDTVSEVILYKGTCTGTPSTTWSSDTVHVYSWPGSDSPTWQSVFTKNAASAPITLISGGNIDPDVTTLPDSSPSSPSTPGSVPTPEIDPNCLKHKETLTIMRSIGTAIGSYQVDYNAFPIFPVETDFNDNILPKNYYEGRNDDAWGTPFRYWSDGGGYTLKSYGKDAAAGGADPLAADIIYQNGSFITPEVPQGCPPLSPETLLKRTVADMRAIGTALGSYQVDFNYFPVAPVETVMSEQLLPEVYYDRTYKDAWGTPFRYVTDANGLHFVLTSYGQDKMQGDGTDQFDIDIIYDSSKGTFISPPGLIP